MAPDTLTAFVGTSGAGKSTIAQLILKFWQVEKGGIYIDGGNLNDITTASQDKVISIMMEYMDGITTFKSYNMTGRKFKRLCNSFEKLQRSSIKIETQLAPCNMLFSIIVDLCTPLMVLMGTYILVGSSLTSHFVIAHRLNTIVTADQILVLDHGEIEECGNHNTLLQKKGHYFRMISEQEWARG